MPHRLTTITKLEISWPLLTVPIRSSLDEADFDEDNLKHVLSLLSADFPALHRLYLSLEKSKQSQFSFDTTSQHVKIITQHLDEFVIDKPGLTECAFALPHLFFSDIYNEAACEPNGDGISATRWDSYRQVWRDVNGEMSIIRIPFVDSYPGPPHQSLQIDTKVAGYWLLEGSNKEIRKDRLHYRMDSP